MAEATEARVYRRLAAVLVVADGQSLGTAAQQARADRTTVARWVEWASAVVETWPDDVTRASFDRRAADEALASAEQIEKILRR